MRSPILQSILKNKCPRCLKGDVWEHGNPYVNLLTHGGRMHELCMSCDLKYERETGFFYGAMYVSYAIGVAIFVTCWVATTVLLPMHTGVLLQIGIIALAIFLLFPVNYHLSRLIWINLFVKHDPEVGLKNE